jgi:hypothetical protein
VSDARVSCTNCGTKTFVPWGALYRDRAALCESCKPPTEVKRIERQVCSRCGGAWYPWPGSNLKTHARCHFSDEEAVALYDRYAADPKLTEAKLAAECGVSGCVIRSTLTKARKLKGLKPGQWP